MTPAQDLVALLKNAVENPQEFASQRTEILQLTRQVTVALEGPFESFMRIGFSPMLLISSHIGLQRGIFAAINASPEPTSRETIATATNIELRLLSPILDHMAMVSLVQEVSPGQYLPTKLTQMMQSALFVNGMIHLQDITVPGLNAINKFLSNPAETRTPFQIGHQTPDNLYQWLEHHPPMSTAFHIFMETQMASLPSWLTVVPFAAEFAAGAAVSTPVFVDVGGGFGQQCEGLVEAFPDMPGRIVLQDRPEVLTKAMTGPQIDKMAYDYLTEQPIKHARAYYFRQIFHNHDDTTCVKILKSQIPALLPDSVLLIDEKVLPDLQVPGPTGEYLAGLNIAMMTFFNSLERREGQWRELLESVGLEIRSIRRFTEFNDSIIVVGLPRA